MNKDLKDKTLGELEELVEKLGRKKYLAGYIFHFIHAGNTREIIEITPLSKSFREQLVMQGYFISNVKILEKIVDKDGTAKYLFELSDGEKIETVLLNDAGRLTLCVSTQIGCAMGCAFCATTKIKLKRNLTAGEIVDQVNAVQFDAGRISNIVYMGMGEPLANYESVVKSVQILNHPEGKNIGIRHLTISNCGIAPAIKKLADEKLHPRLAISLNAPTDKLRTAIMPVNKKYPLKVLLDAVKAYQQRTKERVTFEYVLLKDLNDSTQQAEQLAKLLGPFKCNVNLIEFNPYPDSRFEASGRETISRFADILKSNSIETAVRFKRGRAIFAACGQLGADWVQDNNNAKRCSE
jgi:23S rRNA (adenine2503-C2)-methyltransferase